MFRASDIFGRKAGSQVDRPTAQPQTVAQTRAGSDGGVTNKVWDPATGGFVEEDVPADIQELMGVRKKPRLDNSSKSDAWAAQPASTSRVKLETPTARSPASVSRSTVSVEFRGFGKVELNDAYFEKPDLKLHGKPSYWTLDGDYFVYWQGEVNRWAICDGSSLPAVRAGQYPGWAYKGDHKHFCMAEGWLEAFGGEWQEPAIQVSFRSASHHQPQWNNPDLHQAVAKVEFRGFSMRELNTTYHLKPGRNIQGRTSYWDESGVYFIYWQQQMNRWAICDLKCLEAVRAGQCPGWAYRTDKHHFANATGWMENRSGEWGPAVIETVVVNSSTKGLKVEVSGFSKSELNTQYTERATEEIQGRATFWDPTDTFFIYWQSKMKRWAICDRVSVGAAKQGLTPGWAYRTDGRHFTKAGGWREVNGREWESVKARCIILEGAVREAPRAVKAELDTEGQDGNLSAGEYKELVKMVYTDHNPSKLKDLDQIFDRWADREASLFQSVCEKYGVDHKAFADEHRQQVGTGEETSAGLDEDMPELDAYEYAKHIQSIYEEHNTKKLADLALLLKRYRNRERDLYLEVCEKYGLNPWKYYQKRLQEEDHNAAPVSTPQDIKRES
jgi:hypothetical protein